MTQTVDPLETIYQRHSTRRYTDKVAEEGILAQLVASAANAERLPLPDVRIALVNGREKVARILARYAGVYGLVEGAPHLLVGLIHQDGDEARINLGYVLEQVVLEATHLGLATCWMTGSYHPDQAAEEIGIDPGEHVAATVAVGYPRTDRRARFHDQLVRRAILAHRRKPIDKIVFQERWRQPWSPETAPGAVREILECARAAPSAHNGQPWRFVVEPDRISLILVNREPIDGGIVMSHVTLAARALGYPGKWEVKLGDRALANRLGAPPSTILIGSYQE